MTAEERKRILRQATQFQVQSRQTCEMLEADLERASERIARASAALNDATEAREALVDHLNTERGVFDAATTRVKALRTLARQEVGPSLAALQAGLKRAEADKKNKKSAKAVATLREQIDEAKVRVREETAAKKELDKADQHIKADRARREKDRLDREHKLRMAAADQRVKSAQAQEKHASAAAAKAMAEREALKKRRNGSGVKPAAPASP